MTEDATETLTLFTPRYCLGCNGDLTEAAAEGEMVCPHCGRGFDPGNPATTREEPLPAAEESFWWGVPRLAGYGVLLLFVLGRVVLNALADGLADGGRGGPAFGMALLAVGVPWVAGCVYLLLIVLREQVNPQFIVLLPVCIGLVAILTFGLPPLLLAGGIMVAPLIAMLRVWRVE